MRERPDPRSEASETPFNFGGDASEFSIGFPFIGGSGGYDNFVSPPTSGPEGLGDLVKDAFHVRRNALPVADVVRAGSGDWAGHPKDHLCSSPV